MSDTPIFDEVSNPEPEPIKSVNGVDLNAVKTQPKVVAATVGAGVGSALATITSWIVSITTGTAIPEAVELAIGVVLTAGLAFIGGYWQSNDKA